MGKQVLQIYTIDSDYIKFLSRFDKNVMINHKPFSSLSRPYIGIVLDIGNYLFYAPLTHNGYKWIKFKDHIVLDHGKLGAIKMGRMVPVPKKCAHDLLSLVIRSIYLSSSNSIERKYGALLYRQHKVINEPHVKHAVYKKALAFVENGLRYKYTCNFTNLKYAANLWILTFKPLKNLINNSQILVY